MDDNTARLIMQLQLEDLQELSSNSKGKQRAGEVNDFELALSYYKAELESSTSSALDRHMCMSIARAVHRDGNIITELKAQEDQAAADRILALRLQDGNIPFSRNNDGETHGSKCEANDLDDELLEKMKALYIFGPKDYNDPDAEMDHPESSAWAASRAKSGKRSKDTAKRQCVSCLDHFEFYDVTRAPCSHEYCRGCLNELFTRSLTDESLFPPRCCGQAIPAQANRLFLSLKLVGEFQAKKLEMDTPNRTYCHQPSCSKFIPPQFIGDDVGTCVRCRAKTCVICKGASHVGDCPEDPAVRDLLRVAAENGWQRCYSCHRLVDLRVGCYHMTCLCRAQFCYLCAAPWKTCQCPQWDDNRLLERANVVVNRNIGLNIIPEGEMARRVEQARQQLVDDHECQHGSWRRIGGPRDCEECGHTMPIWLNVCRQCNIMVCRRCRYNRL